MTEIDPLVVGAGAASVMGGTCPGVCTTIGPDLTFGYIAAHHAAGLHRPVAH